MASEDMSSAETALISGAPHAWVREMREDDSLKGLYLIKDKRAGISRRGEPYLMLTLADKTGEIEARVWEKADSLSGLFEKGDVVHIEGQLVSFKGQLQVTVSSIAPAGMEIDRSLFIETSPFPISEMNAELRTLLRDIENRHLRVLLDRFLGDGAFMAKFREAPAAKNFHHCYLGGLLEHTLSVCRLALLVSGQYKRLDKELLLAGAFLHDIGKVQELAWGLEIDYTDEGRLVGHVVLGASMFDDKVKDVRGFPKDLLIKVRHMILSHHGEYLFGSPKRPKFSEAFALHFIDDMDAKLNAVDRIVERDKEEGPWTQYNRLLERYLLKGDIRTSRENEENHRADTRQWQLF